MTVFVNERCLLPKSVVLCTSTSATNQDAGRQFHGPGRGWKANRTNLEKRRTCRLEQTLHHMTWLT
jgi:hypothetical protein